MTLAMCLKKKLCYIKLTVYHSYLYCVSWINSDLLHKVNRTFCYKIKYCTVIQKQVLYNLITCK